MTPTKLKEITERVIKASPDEWLFWKTQTRDGEHVYVKLGSRETTVLVARVDGALTVKREDAEFIEQAKDDVNLLLIYVATLEQIIDDMKKDAGLVPQDATSIDVLRMQNKDLKETILEILDSEMSGHQIGIELDRLLKETGE